MIGKKLLIPVNYYIPIQGIEHRKLSMKQLTIIIESQVFKLKLIFIGNDMVKIIQSLLLQVLQTHFSLRVSGEMDVDLTRPIFEVLIYYETRSLYVHHASNFLVYGREISVGHACDVQNYVLILNKIFQSEEVAYVPIQECKAHPEKLVDLSLRDDYLFHDVPYNHYEVLL